MTMSRIRETYTINSAIDLFEIILYPETLPKAFYQV